jgi:HSP20 family protein
MLTLTTPNNRVDPFESLLQGFFRQPQGSPAQAQPTETSKQSGWSPSADVVADKDGYRFRFDVPGVAKEEIDIQIEDRILTVSGERKVETEQGEDNKFLRRERAVGSFKRTFQLPDDADAASVSASYRDGVLELRVNKNEVVKAKRIEITA